MLPTWLEAEGAGQEASQQGGVLHGTLRVLGHSGSWDTQPVKPSASAILWL